MYTLAVDGIEVRVPPRKRFLGYLKGKMCAFGGVSKKQRALNPVWRKASAVPRMGYHADDSKLRTKLLDVLEDVIEDPSSSDEGEDDQLGSYVLERHLEDDWQDLGSALSFPHFKSPRQSALALPDEKTMPPRGGGRSSTPRIHLAGVDGVSGYSPSSRHPSTTSFCAENRASSPRISQRSIFARRLSLANRGGGGGGGQPGRLQLHQPPPRHCSASEEASEDGETTCDDGWLFVSTESLSNSDGPENAGQLSARRARLSELKLATHHVEAAEDAREKPPRSPKIRLRIHPLYAAKYAHDANWPMRD
ncbi:hypothetical protein F4780DRAFT_721335 [Xylariomycetidae sp. FL0641]|nr:hypothetical protein F4780DRAFT_721335 [Xylariomycetidae sp. FL0641]